MTARFSLNRATGQSSPARTNPAPTTFRTSLLRCKNSPVRQSAVIDRATTSPPHRVCGDKKNQAKDTVLRQRNDGPSAVDAGRFVTGARDIINIRPWIKMRLGVCSAFAAEFQHAVAESAQECAVMRVKDH